MVFRRRNISLRQRPTHRICNYLCKKSLLVVVQILFFLVIAFSSTNLYNDQPLSSSGSKRKREKTMSEKDSIMNKFMYDDGIASQSSHSKDEERHQHIHQTNPLDMKSKLQTRYNDLPSPPWPQLDHRIAKSILDGTMIGFDPSQVSFDATYTIVTAYYQFTSKHGVGEYEKWFTRLLRASEPMIIFLEPGSSWYDFVLKQRTHAPTIIAPIQFDELVMSTTFTTEFWDFMFSIDLEASVHKSSNVYKIWNEKLVRYFNLYLSCHFEFSLLNSL